MTVIGSEHRIHHAGVLLSGRIELTGVWPRCVVWLLRLAIEHAVCELWTERQLELVSCSMRAQLLALPKFVDIETAHTAADLWYSLSRVAHHRDYELSPTVAELRDWHRSASEVCASLTAVAR